MYVFRVAQKRCEHFLQAGDEVIGFPIALQQRLDRLILYSKLPAQEFIVGFQTRDIPRVGVAGCRGLSRQVVACRRLLSRLIVAVFGGDTCRDRSRHAAAGRDNFLDIGDVFVHGFRSDQIFFAERGLYEAANEMALGAVALNGARGAGETGARIAGKRLVD